MKSGGRTCQRHRIAGSDIEVEVVAASMAYTPARFGVVRVDITTFPPRVPKGEGKGRPIPIRTPSDARAQASP